MGSIQKDLLELTKAGVISREIADDIEQYYSSNRSSSTSRLFVIFGILGAILVGLGIILIIAHNWDELPRGAKTSFAFLPLLIGQILCGFTLIKKLDSTTWREASSAFLFFSVGASISLISQIYNIPGNISSFLLTWMLLCLPLVYLMKSSITSLFYLIGITYYVAETCYWTYPQTESYVYWLLLLGILPHYYLLYQRNPKSNFMTFHNWMVPLSVIIALGTLAKNTDELMYVAYFSLFGLLYLIGQTAFFSSQKLINNGYKILGSAGTVVLMLMLSFDWFWEGLREKEFVLNEVLLSPEFIAATIISLLATGLLFIHQKGKSLERILPFAPMFLLFIAVFILGLWSPLAAILINVLVFASGILIIREGAMRDHLGILNYGLLIITALVICRFFDTDLSFVIRGILFVGVGIGFFAANYLLLKRRKTNE